MTCSKAHALDGHALALFLIDVLIETLEDLVNHKTSDGSILLSELLKEENRLFESFANAELPTVAQSLYLPEGSTPKDETLDIEALWKGPSLCRTARLPAQSRYLGYTTNTDKIGGVSIVGQETYDIGIELSEAKGADAMEYGMQLTYEAGGSEREECEVLLKPDYKDYFYARGVHGWVHMTVPNAKEAAAYNYDPTEFKGLIVLILVGCDWGKCAEGELSKGDYSTGKFAMTVNGEPVTELSSFGFDATLLKGEQGLYWKPDESGKFDIGFQIKEEDTYLRVSSVILY